MIASLAGTVAALASTAAVVEVGGVGLLVQCAPATLARLRVGEPATIATTLVVRETELTLYGFADADERDVFETLQGAAGVGPKLALAALGVLGADEVRRAVADEDLTTLVKVPGIGRKGAQRIVLDLKDKIGAPSRSLAESVPAARVPGAASGPALVQEQVAEALAGLGYSAREAEDAVSTAVAAAGGAGAAGAAGTGTGEAVRVGDLDVATLLRASLAVLRPK
jgi:Holliday junction DNA helicase RuvA